MSKEQLGKEIAQNENQTPLNLALLNKILGQATLAVPENHYENLKDDSLVNPIDLLFDSIAKGQCPITNTTLADIKLLCDEAQVKPMDSLIDSIATGKCAVTDTTLAVINALGDETQEHLLSLHLLRSSKCSFSNITRTAGSVFVHTWKSFFDIEHTDEIQESPKDQARADAELENANKDVVDATEINNNPEDDTDLAGEVNLDNTEF